MVQAQREFRHLNGCSCQKYVFKFRLTTVSHTFTLKLLFRSLPAVATRWQYFTLKVLVLLLAFCKLPLHKSNALVSLL